MNQRLFILYNHYGVTRCYYKHYGNAPWKVCENNITWHNKQASSKTVYNILKQLQGLINLLCYSICRLISKHPRSSISSPALANHPKVHNITKIIYYYIRYSYNSRLFCPKSEIRLSPVHITSLCLHQFITSSYSSNCFDCLTPDKTNGTKPTSCYRKLIMNASIAPGCCLTCKILFHCCFDDLILLLLISPNHGSC